MVCAAILNPSDTATIQMRTVLNLFDFADNF